MRSPAIDPTDFPTVLAERDAQIAAYRAELHARDVIIGKLKFQLDGIRRQRFGSKSETLEQLHLRLEEQEIASRPPCWSPWPTPYAGQGLNGQAIFAA